MKSVQESMPVDFVPDGAQEQEDSRTELQKVMGEVLPLFDLDDETFAAAVTDFVDHRVGLLSKNAEDKELGLIGTDKFIGPRTPMYLAYGIFGGREYYLDDQEAYTASFASVRAFYKKLAEKMPPEKAYVNAVIKGSNLGQIQYFEGHRGNNDKRQAVTGDIVSEDVPDASIRDFKGFAACLERAGVTHNTLLIFGVDSVMESGNLKTSHEDGQQTEEVHAFIAVTYPSGKRVVFDPTNPSFTENFQTNQLTAQASLFPIAEDGHSASGTVRHVNIDEDGQETTKQFRLDYSF